MKFVNRLSPMLKISLFPAGIIAAIFLLGIIGYIGVLATAEMVAAGVLPTAVVGPARTAWTIYGEAIPLAAMVMFFLWGWFARKWSKNWRTGRWYLSDSAGCPLRCSRSCCSPAG